MSRSIEETLADCLAMVESGHLTLEDALEIHPELRAELEPLLALGTELRTMPKVETPASLRGYKRPVFRPAPTTEAWWRRILPTRSPSLSWALPLAQVAAALLLAVAVGTGTMVASANSLPDEPLYAVKLAVENAQLAVTSTDQARAELELQFASRRLVEVESAAQQGKSEAVARGIELYQQHADAAAKAAEATPSNEAETVQDSLRNNVEVLRQVQEKVGNERAKEAIGAAIARTVAAPDVPRATKDKNTQNSNRPTARTEPTATATSISVPAVEAPKVTPSPTTTPEPSEGREPPGKARGHSEQPGTTVQGSPQGEEPKGSPQGEEPRGQGQGQRQGVAATETAQPTATHTPTATPAAASDRVVEPDRGNGSEKANGALDTGKSDGKDKDNGKGSQKKDLLGSFIENIQKFVNRR